MVAENDDRDVCSRLVEPAVHLNNRFFTGNFHDAIIHTAVQPVR
jgi:hypothetical protein